VWQVQTKNASLFFQFLWDGCEKSPIIILIQRVDAIDIKLRHLRPIINGKRDMNPFAEVIIYQTAICLLGVNYD